MTARVVKVLAAAALAAGLIGTTALGAGTPGKPKTRSGKLAQLVAAGVATPTGFAFGDRTVFMSDGTPPSAAPAGGVYVLRHGAPLKLADSPPFSFGVAWHRGTLYVSAPDKLLAWSGWNGTAFSKHRVIYKAPKNFPGFNGLAFGADGRLYVGVDVGQANDHGPAKAPYQYDILSLTPRGKHLRVVARGMRQPWQLAFPRGSSSPYVTDLGQDKAAKNPLDAVLRVKPGQNYGFPRCHWPRARHCQGKARPFQTFAAHDDPMGLAIVGRRLFISEFGAGTKARVISIPLRGGRSRVELTGFGRSSNIVGLGAHHGWIYVGQIAHSATELGAVYRFRAS